MSDCRLPATQFFWSLRRRRLWRSCRRRYFLHYYAAAAGTTDAPPQWAQARWLRNALPVPVFVQRLLNAVLREEFYRVPDETGDYPDRNDFVAAAVNRGESEWRRLIRSGPQPPPSHPLLLELLDSGNRVTEVGLRLRETIRSEAARIAAGVWPRLDAVDACRRRPIPSPLEVQLNELRCFAVPAIAFAAPGGELWIIEGVRSGREGADEIALLHKFYAMNALGKAPEKVRSFALAPGEYNFVELAPQLDVSAAVRAIRNDVDEMTGVVADDGMVDPATFPAAPGEACSACPFRKYLCNAEPGSSMDTCAAGDAG